MRVKVIVTMALIFLLFQESFAQENNMVQRKGFVFGSSLGVSTVFLKFPDNSQNDTDYGLDLKFGYMIKPDLALLLTTNVSTYDYAGFGRDRKRDFGVLCPAIQYWVKDKFWVLGGIGIGGDGPVFWDIKNPDITPLETKYYNGFGLVASLGYEFFQSKNNLIIDVKARIMYRNVNLQEGNTSGISLGVLIGVNFY